ncbi:MAG: hypothetical protein ACJ0BN_12815 [Limisphaerales bacterium]
MYTKRHRLYTVPRGGIRFSEVVGRICRSKGMPCSWPYPIHATERLVEPLQIEPVFVALKKCPWALLNLLRTQKIPPALTIGQSVHVAFAAYSLTGIGINRRALAL